MIESRVSSNETLVKSIEGEIIRVGLNGIVG